MGLGDRFWVVGFFFRFDSGDGDVEMLSYGVEES